MLIYLITNKINGKIYVGQTTQSLEKRFKQHCSDSRSGSALNKAIQKYGKENFSVEIIDKANTFNELNEKEAYFVNYYNSIAPHGYNLKFGGGAKAGCSEITRIKMSLANKDRKQSEETKLKKAEKMKGNKHSLGYKHTKESLQKISEASKRKKSEETKLKISKSHLGIKHTEESKKRISEAKRGSKYPPISEETRQKHSKRMTGRKVSEETKRKLSLINVGKILSEDHKRKISEANKRRFLQK